MVRSWASPISGKRTRGWGTPVCRGILSHADYSGVVPESAMEKTICAVDELSGSSSPSPIRPTRAFSNVEVPSGRNKTRPSGKGQPRGDCPRHRPTGRTVETLLPMSLPR